MIKQIVKLQTFYGREKNKIKCLLENDRGEGYIDTAVKILIAVVLGGLLLTGLYLLFSGTVLPTLTTKIKGMFEYKA